MSFGSDRSEGWGEDISMYSHVSAWQLSYEVQDPLEYVRSGAMNLWRGPVLSDETSAAWIKISEISERHACRTQEIMPGGMLAA